jgi:hypothetical protein
LAIVQFKAKGDAVKIIQALKKIEDLYVKQSDLRRKISIHCAHRSNESPPYGDQTRTTVSGWLQSHEDISTEIIRLQLAVQRTNHLTMVTMELGGQHVTHCIAEWIIRRGSKNNTGHGKAGLANSDREAWAALTDRNLQEGFVQDSQGQKVEVKIVRNFDPAARDKKIELYRSEPSIIDSTLEVVNAVTELIEEPLVTAPAVAS